MTDFVKRGTFRFADGPLVHDRKGHYTYSDDFFRQDARILDPQLRTMSFVLCMVAFPSTEAKNYDHVYRNAEVLLSEIGFTDLQVNEDFQKPPENDTLGILAAHKVIEEDGEPVSVLAVTLRGADYGDEWANNITLGETGEATGFASCARILDDFLHAYMTQLGDRLTKRVKFWLVGYSRVGTVVNLVGAKIDREAAAYRTRTEDLYVYTFAAPAAAPIEEERAYPSIHNFVNPHDLVPHLAPRVWGFHRYGTDSFVPLMASDEFLPLYERARKKVASLNPEMRYDPTEFQPICLRGNDLADARTPSLFIRKNGSESWWKDARQDEFLTCFFEFMNAAGVQMGREDMTVAENRRTFARFYQTSAADTAKLYLGSAPEDHARMRKNIENVVDLDVRGRRKIWFYLQLLRGRARNIRKLELYLGKCMRVRAIRTKDVPVRAQEVDETLLRVQPLVRYFLKCASVDAKEHHLSYLPSLIHNLDRIVVSHLPEVMLAWLEVMQEEAGKEVLQEDAGK